MQLCHSSSLERWRLDTPEMECPSAAVGNRDLSSILKRVQHWIYSHSFYNVPRYFKLGGSQRDLDTIPTFNRYPNLFHILQYLIPDQKEIRHLRQDLVLGRTLPHTPYKRLILPIRFPQRRTLTPTSRNELLCIISLDPGIALLGVKFHFYDLAFWYE